MPNLPNPRPRQHLIELTKRYPNAWKQFESFRSDKGTKGLGDWPDWCWLPMAAAYAVASSGRNGGITPSQAADVSALAALGAWRLGQGVYRFDPALYGPITETDLNSDLPHQVLYRLPEWCVYIETPGLTTPDGAALHGAFVHLEYDMARQGRAELRLLLDTDLMLLPLALHLGPWPLAESIARMVDQARSNAATRGLPFTAQVGEVDATGHMARPVVSLVLYLCSQAAELGTTSHRPTPAQPKKVKGGFRWFAPDQPTTWDVGVRLGAALRRSYQASQTPADGATDTHAAPRAHIRRAHWHGYWSGARDDASARRLDLRWMPPIPVNVDDPDHLPSTIHPIR